MPLGSGEFEEAWPRIVRALASFTGSLDDAEEYAAEAVARAAAHERDGGPPIESYAAWCTSVARRAWLDDVRRRSTLRRLAPELARPEADHTAMDADDLPLRGTEGLDDRLALLFVACDEAISAPSRMVLALRVVCGLTIPEIAGHLGIQETAAAARLTRAKRALADARGTFSVPDATERARRLPVVIACVAGMFTVAHRTVLDPADALADTGRQALSIADALVAAHPADTEVRGLRAVIRLGLARRPGRVDDTGTGLALDEVDRSRWDGDLLRAGLADATLAAAGDGRFALEAAIAGLHSSARSFADTDWPRIVTLYGALEQRWPSPSVRVARLVATAHAVSDRSAALADVERELESLERHGPAYASRDASLALADLEWHTGRQEQAAARYRDLADVMSVEPLRRFCLRRAVTPR
ncbi:sigma-70 family RNA polymerase sigma factor [Terrabacter aeriphilus]|uniref:Sigma-70 family RNA polymerase sigma factor n=1 Tax=Terrabacter aeriphilus TaxID=515662 RepID=A0ABP9J3S8_9MICO